MSRTNTEDEALKVSKFSGLIGVYPDWANAVAKGSEYETRVGERAGSLGAGQCQILAHV
jgi:hypothetical protein